MNKFKRPATSEHPLYVVNKFSTVRRYLPAIGGGLAVGLLALGASLWISGRSEPELRPGVVNQTPLTIDVPNSVVVGSEGPLKLLGPCVEKFASSAGGWDNVGGSNQFKDLQDLLDAAQQSCFKELAAAKKP